MKKWIPFLFFCLLLTSTNTFAQYVLNGDATLLEEDCYLLTTELEFQNGTVWYTDQIDLNESFDIEFTINLGDIDANGADGIVFVLQTFGTDAIGLSGGGIGFEGFEPSLGIEFDTWQNGDFGDPVSDHIAICRDGIINHNLANNLAGPVDILPGGLNIEDGLDHVVRVDWDATNFVLDVYIDCEFRLSLDNYDMVNEIFMGDPNVWFGFTGATGGSVNNQSVCLSPNILEVSSDQQICQGDNVQLFAGGSVDGTYEWMGDETLSETDIADPFASPLETTTYIVTFTNLCGFSKTDSIVVTVEPSPDLSIEPQGNLVFCEGESLELIASGADEYVWLNGPMGPTYIVTEPGEYTVLGVIGNCEIPLTVEVLSEVCLGCTLEDFTVETNCVEENATAFNVVISFSGESEYTLYDQDFSVLDQDLSAGTYELGPFEPGELTEITIVDDLIEGCFLDIDVIAPDCFVCSLNNLSVNTNCVDGSPSAFMVEISFEGLSQYTLYNQELEILQQNLMAGTYEFGPFEPGDLTEISIVDDLIEDCFSEIEIIAPTCFVCEAEAGVMDDPAALNCAGTNISINASGFNNSDDYSQNWILTQGSDYEIVDISNDGSFGSPAPGTYNVLAINYFNGDAPEITVGENALEILDDPAICLEMNLDEAVSFTILNPVALITDYNCNSELGIYTLTFSFTGGLPQYVEENGPTGIIDEIFYFSNGDLNGTFLLSDNLVIEYAENSEYSVNISDAFNCFGNETQTPAPCSKNSIELLDFYGETTERSNELFWTTASEKDHDFFTIEKSLDGINFMSISKIESEGNSNFIQEYNFSDNEIANSKSFYRILDTDINGNTNYSNIVLLERRTLSDISIYPNPFENYINLNFLPEGHFNIQILDVSGKIIYQDAIASMEQNHLKINTSDFVSGIYFIQIKGEQFSFNQKILKK